VLTESARPPPPTPSPLARVCQGIGGPPDTIPPPERHARDLSASWRLLDPRATRSAIPTPSSPSPRRIGAPRRPLNSPAEGAHPRALRGAPNPEPLPLPLRDPGRGAAKAAAPLIKGESGGPLPGSHGPSLQRSPPVCQDGTVCIRGMRSRDWVRWIPHWSDRRRPKGATTRAPSPTSSLEGHRHRSASTGAKPLPSPSLPRRPAPRSHLGASQPFVRPPGLPPPSIYLHA